MRIGTWLRSCVGGLAPRRHPALLAAVVFAWLLAVVPLAPAFAQTPPATPAPTTAPAQSTQIRLSCGPHSGLPDVVLDVPNLSVEQIKITVDKLLVELNLDASLANLVELHAGLKVSVDKIDITITGVKAEVHLTVCLDNVKQIITKALQTIDQNPQLLQGLLNSVTNLLSTTVNSLGQTVLRTVDSVGNILERTVDSAATIIGQTVAGNISSLQVISQTVNAAGQTVKQVKDTSGAIIEVTLDAAGNVISSRVVTQGGV